MNGGRWLQQPDWTWTCVKWPWTSTPLPLCHWLGKKKAGLADGPGYDCGSGAAVRCCEQVLISVVGEDAIGGYLLLDLSHMGRVYLLTTAGPELCQGHFYCSHILIWAAQCRRRSCRWRNFCADWWSSFYGDQLPHDQLSNTLAQIIIFVTAQPHMQSVLDNQIWSLILTHNPILNNLLHQRTKWKCMFIFFCKILTFPKQKMFTKFL